MFQDAFNKFYWGFLFVMLDFRIQGVDILPDIVGYCLFAAGLGALVEVNGYFRKAKDLNIVMIILSIFQIYEKPAQNNGININFGALGAIGFLLGLASTILSLFVIYNLFMGIRDMASEKYQASISHEAESRWTQYLILQLASLFVLVLLIIPPLALIALIGIFVFSIALTLTIMGFMKRCGASL